MRPLSFLRRHLFIVCPVADTKHHTLLKNPMFLHAKVVGGAVLVVVLYVSWVAGSSSPGIAYIDIEVACCWH